MPRTIVSNATNERIVALVTARTPHGTGVDIHGDVAEIAVLAPGGTLGTAPADWKTATIDPVPVQTVNGVSTWAVTLSCTVGLYAAYVGLGPCVGYVRVHDNPDTPVKAFDTFTFVTA